MTLHQLRQSLASFWAVRDERERRMLTAGAAAVGLALLYLVAIGPAYTGSMRLQRDLPSLRQQALALQALSRQAQGLRANAPASVTLSTQESIDATLSRKNLKAQSVAVSADLVRIQLSNVSFSGVLDWLDELQKSAHVTVMDCQFSAQSQPDMVNATLNLRQPKTDDAP